MKKLVLLLLAFASLSLIGCGKEFPDEAGIYKLISAETEEPQEIELFKTFTIELTVDGLAKFSMQRHFENEPFRFVNSFDIDHKKSIVIFITDLAQEEWDYVDGKIIMGQVPVLVDHKHPDDENSFVIAKLTFSRDEV